MSGARQEKIDKAFYDLTTDGVTYSLLAGFRDCREMARLGLQGWAQRTAGFPLVFGNVAHAALERVYGDVQTGVLTGPPDAAHIHRVLTDIEGMWRAENPIPTNETKDDFQLTLLAAEAILPAYFKYWRKDDFEVFKWLHLEHEFRIPYTVTLPPAKVYVKGKGLQWVEREVKTFIRGKMDGLYEHRDKPGVRLLETKTKGRIDPGNLEDILPFQLQPGIYLYAARKLHNVKPVSALLNVIRRPGLRRKVKETVKEFGTRMAEDITARPDFYFIRMELTVDDQDFNRFDAEFDDLLKDFVLWKIGEGPHYKNDNYCENKHGTCGMLPICGRQFFGGHFIRAKVFSELEEI